jgi:DNA repair protein RadC
MHVYEAKIQYNIVGSNSHEALDTPQKIVDYMAGAFEDSPLQEHFYVICLNRKNRPMCRHRITSGIVSASMAHPREVFRTAVLATACAIICIHNHPSGDPQPSQQDISMTRRLKDAATIMDIELVDHIVMGSVEDDPNGKGYFSFRESGYV